MGDVNLSNIILNNAGSAKGIFEDDDDGLNADAFIARNTTNVRRKPSSPKKSQSRHSRKGSKHDELEGIDPEDDDFINEVTEPMKAKTKNELLGRGGSNSRASSRSRSRSNDISQRSNKKPPKGSRKGGSKILTQNSQRSYGKGGASERNNSQTEIMAMATAGEADPVESAEEEEQHRKIHLKKQLNTSSSKNIKPKSSQRKSARKGIHQRPFSSNPAIENTRQAEGQMNRQTVLEDEEFIKKVRQFNSYLDKKKLSYQQERNKELLRAQGARSSGAMAHNTGSN